MNVRFTAAACLAVFGGLALFGLPGVRQAAGQPTAESQPGEVLTRGPLHEAFAKVVLFNPRPGNILSVRPPEAIEELPPQQQPEGGGYVWIPGYWTWDDDRQDFVWLSGLWRKPPPGAQWVPGYWAEAENGHRWVSGFWLPVDGTEGNVRLQYLPVPPESREAGPNTPQPSEDFFWTPGYWTWQEGRYLWRHGHWGQIAPGWVWVPAHYAWTPRGCMFLAGRWDHLMSPRGVPFCPVHFSPDSYTRPGFQYEPSVVLDTSVLGDDLFCGLKDGHYYFGDYYDRYYETEGIVPWFALYHGRSAYDQFYVYRRWYFGRRNLAWALQTQQQYEYRVEHQSARPPQTLAAMQQLASRAGDHGRASLPAKPLAAAANDVQFPIRLQAMPPPQREQMADLAKQFALLAAERSRLESRHDAARAPIAEAREAELPLGEVRQATLRAIGAPKGDRLEESPAPSRPPRYPRRKIREQGRD